MGIFFSAMHQWSWQTVLGFFFKRYEGYNDLYEINKDIMKCIASSGWKALHKIFGVFDEYKRKNRNILKGCAMILQRGSHDVKYLKLIHFSWLHMMATWRKITHPYLNTEVGKMFTVTFQENKSVDKINWGSKQVCHSTQLVNILVYNLVKDSWFNSKISSKNKWILQFSNIIHSCLYTMWWNLSGSCWIVKVTRRNACLSVLCYSSPLRWWLGKFR